jgi:hypothetical protein
VNPFVKDCIVLFILVSCLECTYFYEKSVDEVYDYCIRKNKYMVDIEEHASCCLFNAKLLLVISQIIPK